MKALFSQPEKSIESERKQPMGAASLTFVDDELDFCSSTALQLTCYVFKKLDRQAVSAMEKCLNIDAVHRRSARRLVAELNDTTLSLRKILKPMKQHDHHMAYSIFNKVCMMTSKSQRYDMSFLQTIIEIGKDMDLSQGEIYRLIAKNGLAD